jgi:hypothetical protein
MTELSKHVVGSIIRVAWSNGAGYSDYRVDEDEGDGPHVFTHVADYHYLFDEDGQRAGTNKYDPTGLLIGSEEGSESVALIRLNGALVKARKYVDDKFSGKKRNASSLTSSYRKNAEGSARGRAAADKMVIGRKGVAGGKGTRGLLS